MRKISGAFGPAYSSHSYGAISAPRPPPDTSVCDFLLGQQARSLPEGEGGGDCDLTPLGPPRAATERFLTTETQPQKRRLENRARRVGKPTGSPRKTNKNPENPQKLRDPAPT